jgi:hypothetical protein
MQKNHKRALRRHHLARIKQKRIAYHGDYVRHLPHAEQLRHVGRFAHTMPSCSCWMCGNLRRYFGEVTLQEKRFAEQGRLEWEEETKLRQDP